MSIDALDEHCLARILVEAGAWRFGFNQQDEEEPTLSSTPASTSADGGATAFFHA